jgi:hypothetical protein
MNLALNSQPRLRHEKGSNPRKCFGIQTHFHKCEKMNPNNPTWFFPLWELRSYNVLNLWHKSAVVNWVQIINGKVL